MTEKEAYLVLNAVPELGPVRIRNLVNSFGSAVDVLNADALKFKGIEGVNKKAVDNILNWKKFFDLKKECKLIEKQNVKVISFNEPEYPVLLKEIYDPPVVLYIKGGFLPEDSNAIAIVGARTASFYGINTAKRFARELASRDFTIVSGLARGIDTAAHEGAIQTKGRTIAVFGCGINVIYPPENEKLAEKISSLGAVLSEFPMDTPPSKYNFPKRNRIISGLCLGVVVVEAGKYSGSLITARLAAEQGRDVFSVPGRIDSVTSQGINVLIKNGAKPVFDIDDIIAELEPQFKTQITQVDSCVEERAKSFALPGAEGEIFELLCEEPITVDELVGAVNVPINEIWSSLVNLELKGFVQRLPGSKFIKK